MCSKCFEGYEEVCEGWVDTCELGNEFYLDVPYANQERLKCFWVGNWTCTDTSVGYRMYFFDDEPIAFSVQKGRKSDETFHWFNENLAMKVREYLISLIAKDNEDNLNIKIVDINEDIGDSYKIEFNSQILNSDRVKFNNEKVEIIERIKNQPYGIDTELKIRLSTGEEKHVDIRDLAFDYHVK